MNDTTVDEMVAAMSPERAEAHRELDELIDAGKRSRQNCPNARWYTHSAYKLCGLIDAAAIAEAKS